MGETQITPKAVVARYRELGIPPCSGAMQVELDDHGCVVLRSGVTSTCALGIMGLGMTDFDLSDRRLDVQMAIAARLGVMFWPFVVGFDTPGRCRYPSLEEQRCYELGMACRRAVEAAGLWPAEEQP